MGYYDDDYESSSRTKSQKGSRRSVFVAGMVGVILGAFLVIFSVPVLSGLGVLPNYYGSNYGAPSEGIPDTNGLIKNVSVNVTTDVTQAVDKASGAVVEVINIQKSNFWTQQEQPTGSGSGVIYKKVGDKAFLVTNNHVVEGASDLEVTLADGTKLKGTLRGTDPVMDLAVVEIDGTKVKTVAQFGSSSTLKRGEPAIAIGNPLGSFPGSVTEGIISAVNRSIPVDINGDGNPDWNADVIQTDAAINPGNSGGALLNIDGQVIGINSSKIAQQAVEGIGFAIPSDVAKPIISDLEKYGEVRRSYLGVAIVPLSQVNTYHRNESLKLPDNVQNGVVVTNVAGMSPAASAGLKELDVIVELNGQKVTDPASLRKILYSDTKIGQDVPIVYYRDGKKYTTTVKLGKQS